MICAIACKSLSSSMQLPPPLFYHYSCFARLVNACQVRSPNRNRKAVNFTKKSTAFLVRRKFASKNTPVAYFFAAKSLPERPAPTPGDWKCAKQNSARFILRSFGTPEGTRTPDLLVRSQSLYPTELPAHTALSSALQYNSTRAWKLQALFAKNFRFLFRRS